MTNNYETQTITGFVKAVFKTKNFDTTGFVNVVVEDLEGKIHYSTTKQNKSISVAISSKGKMKNIIIRNNDYGSYFLSAVKVA